MPVKSAPVEGVDLSRSRGIRRHDRGVADGYRSGRHGDESGRARRHGRLGGFECLAVRALVRPVAVGDLFHCRPVRRGRRCRWWGEVTGSWGKMVHVG